MLTSLFDALGRTIARRPLTTVAVWFVLAATGFLTAATGLGGPSLLDRVEVTTSSAPGSDSATGDAVLGDAVPGGGAASLVVRGVEPADSAVASTMGTLSAELADLDGVATVVNPYVLDGGPANPAAQDLVSEDGDGFVTYVLLEDGTGSDAEAGRAVVHDAVVDRLEAVPAALRREAGDGAAAASGLVTSTDLVDDAVRDQARDDLRTGTLVALPVALLVAALALGGLLAGAVPLAAAVAALGTGLGVLYVLTYLPSQAVVVDASLPAVVAMLATGITLGNGLFLTARFREELLALAGLAGEARLLRRRRRDVVVVEAVARTTATAGRAVTLSALVLVAATAGLLVLSPAVVLGAGAGALAAAVLALLAAVTLVPALLALTERRLVRPDALHLAVGLLGQQRYREARERAARPRRVVARFLRRRRWAVAVGCLVVLAGLVAPAVALQVRSTSAIELLPDDAEQRRFVEILAASYPASDGAEVTVLARAAPDDVGPLAAEIGELDGVTRVDGPRTLGPGGSGTLQAGHAVMGVHTGAADATSREVQDVVRAVRGLEAPYEVLVTGRAATQVDLAGSLAQRGWPAAAAVAVVTALLVLLATGSVAVAAAAVVSGGLTLGVSLGVLVLAFQRGALTLPLGVASVGGIEVNVLATVAALAFGLGCAHTLLVTSRVAELRAGGTPDAEAVRRGLHRSGRSVLAAVLVVVVVCAAFMAGGGLVINETGFAVTVAALVDLLVLALLWPTALAVLGRRAWWAPPVVRSAYARLG
ncbi:putative drug exporter of the RND superfamily [Promicromonospora umidemergens]|uniref:Membrane transport protein MMPL domain-containing protein n=1 Tax=Promicromonospora umidemergens TaxID=629679 RepID=A0ABP8XP56_9MICO|nr:MMPL family transporter [Promicromonospora umidemergens]MCP2281832.1 putative drug exporter of the RND superfamily [Promicromonospora umidemergens]